MPMYNLLEHSKNYRKTIGSLYNYYRDELSDNADDNNFGIIQVVNSNTFKYKKNNWQYIGCWCKNSKSRWCRRN